VLRRKRESVVATNTPPGPAGAAAVRATPTRRRQRIFPRRGSTPSTSPACVWATSIPSTSASGAPMAGVDVRQICLPLLRRSAWIRPSGRELAANTVSPVTRTPPTIMPGSRADQSTSPLARSIAYTLRSMLPPYSVLSWICTGRVKRRPARAVHIGSGASPARLAATGAGGGRKLTQPALTPPRSRARLNAPLPSPTLPADTAWQR
jgi:hypothetical protein